MLQTLLGREGFRAGMDLYFERHDGDAATIEDFLACFADANGADLSQFALWYHQAGTPTITVSHRYEPEKERLTLELKQDLPETPDRKPKQPMHIPIAFGLVGPDGQDLSFSKASGASVRRRRHPSHQRAAHEIVFEGVQARPIPSLFREFSAPVHVQSDLTPEDRLFLIGRDPDPVQPLGGGAADRARDARARDRGDPRRRDAGIRSALRARSSQRLADNDELDPAFRALALQLAERDRHRAGDRPRRRSRRHPSGAARAAGGARRDRSETLVAEAAARSAPRRPLLAGRGERRPPRLRACRLGLHGRRRAR